MPAPQSRAEQGTDTEEQAAELPLELKATLPQDMVVLKHLMDQGLPPQVYHGAQLAQLISLRIQLLALCGTALGHEKPEQSQQHRQIQKKLMWCTHIKKGKNKQEDIH